MGDITTDTKPSRKKEEILLDEQTRTIAKLKSTRKKVEIQVASGNKTIDPKHVKIVKTKIRKNVNGLVLTSSDFKGQVWFGFDGTNDCKKLLGLLKVEIQDYCEKNGNTDILKLYEDM